MARHVSRVFVSYSRKDADLAARLQQHLAAAGRQVVMDTSSIRAGDPYVQRIREQIGVADRVVVLYTPHAAASAWIHFEIGLAAGRGEVPHGHLLLPIRTDDGVGLPGFVTAVHCETVPVPWGPGALAGMLESVQRRELELCVNDNDASRHNRSWCSNRTTDRP